MFGHKWSVEKEINAFVSRRPFAAFVVVLCVRKVALDADRKIIMRFIHPIFEYVELFSRASNVFSSRRRQKKSPFSRPQ